MGAEVDTYQGGQRQDLPLATYDSYNRSPLHHVCGITHVSGWAEARSTFGAIQTFEEDRGG
jgi:hypothetical protein